MDGEQRNLGRFRLDMARRQLLRDEKPVRLGSRALDILCILASAEGKIVSKDELMARVWPATVVEENNLHVHVSALRKALDEEANGQSYLVTVPGRGYRFIAPIARATSDLITDGLPTTAPIGRPSAAPKPQVLLSGERGDGPERRQLTVMCCQLTGATALAQRPDPEDIRDLVAAYHRHISEVVGQLDGFVASHTGASVRIYFGYPQAHEDDAERAVRCALTAIDRLIRLNANKVQTRIGLATGTVLVGDLIGGADAPRPDVIGEAAELATRLQALAPPNSVLIDANTRRLTGDLFVYHERADLLDGLAESTRAYEALGPSTIESRFEALRPPPLTPLVGRDEEIQLLLRRWRRAKSSDGQMVLISGEPGIGKSRLAQTLFAQLAGEPHIRMRLSCSPHHQDSALYPMITQLEGAAGFRREDTAQQRLDKLEALLAPATDQLGEAAPLLAALLSLPTGARYAPLALTPQKQKKKTLRTLVAQVEGLAARQPVLMLFEDAQWSDPTSLELLDLIIDRVPTLPVLLIVTSRPEFTPPWIGRPIVSLISLNRLAPRQRAEMIAGVTGGKALPQEITDQIIDRTDGVPLFVEELTKAVVESGMLAAAGDHYTAGGPLAPLAIPASLQASLLARLDRLAPVREVAQIGAALGRQFSHELIGAVAPMPQAQLDEALAQLVGAELIYRRGTPPDAEYTFKHALVQDAAYSTLLRSRRQQLHARIVATLEGQFVEIVAAQPALLAHHCTEAGVTEKAIAYWLAAGRQAWGRSATAEAVALLHRGLVLVPALPDTDGRRETELDLQIALGQALIMNRGWAAPELVEVHSRARQLASTLNRPRALLFALWGQFTHDCWARADLKRARRLAAELRELGDTAGDVPIQVMGCYASGMACFHLGEFAAGQAYLEKGLALFDPAHRPSYSELLSNDARVQLRLHSSWQLACLGHLDQALFQRDAAVEEARRLSHPPTLAVALTHAWLTGTFVRLEPGSLLQYPKELLALATEHGLGYIRTVTLIMRGWCLAALGRSDEGIPLLTAGLAGLDELGFLAYRPMELTRLGDACRMAGQWQVALGHLAEAQRRAEETEERWYQVETHRLTGDVLLAMGDPSGAEESYHEAIAIAQQQSARLWELGAAASLARLWHDQGKRTEAHALLAPVYNWFTEGFDTPVLQQARALLNYLNC